MGTAVHMMGSRDQACWGHPGSAGNSSSNCSSSVGNLYCRLPASKLSDCAASRPQQHQGPDSRPLLLKSTKSKSLAHGWQLHLPHCAELAAGTTWRLAAFWGSIDVVGDRRAESLCALHCPQASNVSPCRAKACASIKLSFCGEGDRA